MNFGEFFFSFLGKCLIMLSMTSMTASYATVSLAEFQVTVFTHFQIAVTCNCLRWTKTLEIFVLV